MKQGEWFDDQCPGCVEGYPDCALGRSFLFSYDRSIKDENLRVIESGICPFRTNGTGCFVGGKYERIDLSTPSTPERGKAVADAISEYVRKYPDERD